MSNVFHFNDIFISNFRCFRELKIGGFKGVNIIGGENGTGKSSILEAGFHVADRGNPNTLFYDFAWRSVNITPTDFPDAFKQIAFEGDIHESIVFQAKTTKGEYTSKYKYGAQTISQPVSTNILQSNLQRSASADASSMTSPAGFRLTGHHGTQEDLNVKVQFNGAQLTMQPSVNRFAGFTTCMIVNSVTRKQGPDQSTRFSDALRGGNINKLMEFIHLVHPRIAELTLLNVGGTAVVHARISGNVWVPISFLGEGASDLFTICLFMVSSKDGIVFLDEFDSVVHYSLLEKLWTLIITLQRELNVQVFATTHSNESLQAAVRSAEQISAIEDFTYNRLRRTKTGEIKPVSYGGAALRDNIRENWEVR